VGLERWLDSNRDRTIAERCGVSGPFVASVRAEVVPVANGLHQEERVTSDGKVRKVKGRERRPIKVVLRPWVVGPNTSPPAWARRRQSEILSLCHGDLLAHAGERPS
jgi:hypothetical protein